jgi:TAG lipase/lysophosphatidylethanolamine acyltransferase
VAGLFNVNHYIVSQARPYLIPFLQSDMHGPPTPGRRNTLTAVRAFATRMVGLETRHRLRQLDRLRLLPPSIRRFLVDEHLPGPSVTLVPQISLADFVRLMETPTRETLEYWILRGERSVWPAVAALRVRCWVEMELDRAYQDVRRLKAGDLRRRGSRSLGFGLEQGQGVVGGGEMGKVGEGWKGKGKGKGKVLVGGGEVWSEAGEKGEVRPRAWSITARCPPAEKSGL